MYLNKRTFGRTCLAFILLGLAACTPAQIAETPVPVFRNTAAQIASQTDVSAARMAGNWVIRQSFANHGYSGVRLTIDVLPDDALQVSFPRQICVDAQCIMQAGPLVLLRSTGPGRWMPVDPPQYWPSGELWVMWMDFDSRTAAIGTPSGEFGWIMDKNPTGGRDRIIAARDIMDWFGYDMARLEEVSP